MKALFVLLSFLTVFSLNTMSQSLYEIRRVADFFDQMKLERGDSKLSLKISEIEGSPYLNDEFIAGSVFTTSKTEYVDVPLRYNIYNDQIEFLAGEDNIQALAVPEIVENIEIGDHNLEYLPYINVKKIRRGFFILLEKGNASLYARPQVTFQEAKKAGAYQNAQPAKFLKRPDEYYIRIGSDAARFVQKKKDLTDIFNDHKKQVDNFMRENRISPNKPEELKKLVQYYNTL